jgi:hypothetical protein
VSDSALLYGHTHHTHAHSGAQHTHSINTGGSHTHGVAPQDPPPDFKIDDYVEFPGYPGPLYQIVGGEEPFWGLKHVGGPQMAPNYHKTCFGAEPPKMPYVIQLVIAHVPEMKVLAIFASGDE